MKVIQFGIFATLLMVSDGIVAEETQTTNNLKISANTPEWNDEIYSYSYEEAAQLGKKSGRPFIGVGAQNFGNPGRNGLIYETRISYGKTDSSGTAIQPGTTKNISTSVFSTELSWSQSFDNYNFFAGLGYRHLFDDWGGQTTSSGMSTYDRRTDKIYMPLGLMSYFENSGYLKVQYNHLISGNQKSYTSVRGGAHHDHSYKQDNGFGLDLEYAPDEKYSLFFRYWDIDTSKVTQYLGANAIIPDNDTTEFGAKIRF